MTKHQATKALAVLDRSAAAKDGPWSPSERRDYEREVARLKKLGAK